MTNPENDSDTRLFRFDKKMFLELATKDEQDKRLAYGNVVTQIYIEEKDGAELKTELKKLKDEKQVSDLKRKLEIDDSQNREEIEKRKNEREREERERERDIEDNEVVKILIEYNRIIKSISKPILNNYMMYLDKDIKIEVKNEKIEVKNGVNVVNVNNINVIGDVDKKNYIEKIIKSTVGSDINKLNDIIDRRHIFIITDINIIQKWDNENNIISKYIDIYKKLNEAKEHLDKATADANAAKKAAAEAKGVAEAAAAAKGVAEAAAAKKAEAEAEAAATGVAEAAAAMEEYLDANKNANKKAITFENKINNVKVHLRDNKAPLAVEQLIKTAGLDYTGYEAIQSINTLNKNVEEFNNIFGIDN